MERNADDYTGSSSGGASDVSGSTTAGGASFSNEGSNVADRARDFAGNAKDKLADVGANVREGAGNAKNKLADALEAGAEKLRHRGATGQISASTGTADVTVTGDGVSNVTNRVAGGMQATADWLREADLDSMRSGVERQVKEHPGRTLLIAVGIGYLLGKAFRK